MTRTPDCHFAAEARHNGTKMVVFAPDFNQVAKYADEYIPLHAGQDGAWWMAACHVLLKECHHQQRVPYFLDYAKKYTDCPYLVELVERDGVFEAGQLLRANRIAGYEGWKTATGSFSVLEPGQPLIPSPPWKFPTGFILRHPPSPFLDARQRGARRPEPGTAEAPGRPREASSEISGGGISEL